MAPFPMWLDNTIQFDLASSMDMENMAVAIAFPPSNVIFNFENCMAYGNHYKVIIGDVEMGFTTFDNGIALVTQLSHGMALVTMAWRT